LIPPSRGMRLATTGHRSDPEEGAPTTAERTEVSLAHEDSNPGQVQTGEKSAPKEVGRSDAAKPWSVGP